MQIFWEGSVNLFGLYGMKGTNGGSIERNFLFSILWRRPSLFWFQTTILCRGKIRDLKAEKRPAEKVIKVNFDASPKQNRRIGLAVIFWDHNGKVLAVDSLLIPVFMNPILLKLLLFKWAFETTLNLSFYSLQYESDCQRLVNEWN